MIEYPYGVEVSGIAKSQKCGYSPRRNRKTNHQLLHKSDWSFWYEINNCSLLQWEEYILIIAYNVYTECLISIISDVDPDSFRSVVYNEGKSRFQPTFFVFVFEGNYILKSEPKKVDNLWIFGTAVKIKSFFYL